jgi:KDO2-lipid IV(A) lauroyltransferase
MKDQQFSLSLLHLRYWPTWFGFGLWWLLAQLPYPLQLKMGRGLGRLLYHVAKRRRRIAERNIALCFPHLGEAQQEHLVRANIESTAIAVFESGIAWFWPTARIRKLFRVEGIEHLRQAEEQGQGVLLLAMHFTNLDIGAVMLCLEHSIDAMYRPHDNPVYEYLQRRGRENRFEHSQVIPKQDMRTTIKLLRSGRAIWYAPDQDYGRKHSVFAPFFGVPAATVTATAQLARLGQAQVIPFVQVRQPGGGYVIRVYPPLEDYPSGDEWQDARRVNGFIEERVKENPEQYMWVHRRFKTRPPGEPPIYE